MSGNQIVLGRRLDLRLCGSSIAEASNASILSITRALTREIFMSLPRAKQQMGACRHGFSTDRMVEDPTLLHHPTILVHKTSL
jgi:hypothetical protein